MESNYAKYIREREGKKIVEDDRGFAVYSILDDLKAVYIEDIYVRPEFRNQNVASDYADKIAAEAKSNGFQTLIGTVKPTANSSTASLKVLLAYGFELASSEHDAIYFRKAL